MAVARQRTGEGGQAAQPLCVLATADSLALIVLATASATADSTGLLLQ